MPNAVTAIFGGDARPLERTIDSVLESVAKLGEGLGIGLGVEQLVSFDEKILSMGRALKDTSERLGVTTDEVQSLNYAAQETGSNLEHVANGLDRLAKSKEAALSGTKDGEKLVQTFSDFGISIDRIRSSTPKELFDALGESIEKTGVNSKVTSDILGLMGRAGSQLIPTLKELAKNSADFEHSPLKMTKEDIDSIDRAAKSWERFGTAVKVFGAEAQVGLGDIFTSKFFDIINPFKDSDTKGQEKRIRDLRGKLDVQKLTKGPALEDFTYKGDGVAAGKKSGEGMAEIEARRLDLAQKIFDNSLKSMTATQKEEALKKEIAKHEANAAFYASVGENETDKKALDEKIKAEELRGQLEGIETKKDKQANTKLSLNAQQQIGSYARTPGSWNETKADIKAIRQSLSHIHSNHNAPPGPQRPKFGAHSH